MTQESMPDDMETAAWITEHREQMTKLVDSTEDLRLAINTYIGENMETAMGFLFDVYGDVKPPKWLLYQMAMLAKEVRELATSCTGVAIMGKAALALNQPIEQDTP